MQKDFGLVLLERFEYPPTGFTARLQATPETCGKQPFQNTAVDFKHSHHRGDIPHVIESYHSELVAPLCSNTDTKAESVKLVAKSQPAAETRIAQLPNAVNTMDALWLG